MTTIFSHFTCIELEFTPLEFETSCDFNFKGCGFIRIYSVGVWNSHLWNILTLLLTLEFTPLEFETRTWWQDTLCTKLIRIYSVGVWNCFLWCQGSWRYLIRIYSVGVWNGDGSLFVSQICRIRIYSVGVWN